MSGQYSLGERLKGFADGVRAFEVMRDEARDSGDEASVKKWEDAIKGTLEGMRKYLVKEGVL